MLATWGSRLPAIQRAAHLSGEEVGWLIAALAVGTCVALLAAGRIVGRIRARSSVRVGTALCAIGLMLAAARPTGPGFAAAAILLGVGDALVSVAINIEGAALGRQQDDARLLPLLHGAWSCGALLGSLGGAMAVVLHVGLSTHLQGAAVLILAGGLTGSRNFERPPEHSPRLGSEYSLAGRSDVDSGPATAALDGSREARRRTFALGLIALGAAFAEGAANDWLTLALADGYRLSHGLAAVGLGVFITGMLTGRLCSGWIPQRYRPDQLLLTGVVLVVTGTAFVLIGGLVVLPSTRAGGIGLAAAGLLAWGLGAALGMPMALGAAAQPPPQNLHDSSSSSARVGVVSTIGYAAFLGGPPILGWFAAHIGFLWTLVGAPVVMVVSVIAAGMCHPLRLTMRISEMAHGLSRVSVHPAARQSARRRSPDFARPPVRQAPDDVSELSQTSIFDLS